MKAERIQHDLVQGTPAWEAFRSDHDGASEAAAMLGLSPYATRTELMRQKATGITPEPDEGKLRLFAAGHMAEAAARAMADDIIGEELYPVTYSYGRMSASCDGINAEGDTAVEHKLYSADLAEAVARGELPDEYMPQCQQVMMVTGAERLLFMVSDGTPENCVHMWIEPDKAWQKRITAGWKQFHADLADYVPPEVIPAAVAAPTMALPAVSIKVEGSVALISNLDVFGAGLKAFIAKIPEKPSTDQEFADCKAACKSLQEAQDALDAAEAHAMGQVSSFDEMRRTKALYFDLARSTRLAVEKLVTARESAIKVEIVQKGRADLAAHISGLNARLGKPYMPTVPENFSGAIKSKRTIASLQNAVDTELARVKIEANAIADRIGINLNTLRDLAKDHAFLFADAGQIVLKENDDLTALVKMRISEHKAAEEKRIQAEAEKARERIRAEEAAKLVAAAAAETKRLRTIEEAEYAKLLREQQDRERRERDEAEQKAKEQAAAQPPVAPHPSSPGPIQSDSPNGAIGIACASLGQRDSGDKVAPLAAPYGRPRDDALISAVALAFDVNADIARRWLIEAFARKAA